MFCRLHILIFPAFLICVAYTTAKSLTKADSVEVNDMIEKVNIPVVRTANGCHCVNYSCGCCSHLQEKIILLNATVCITATLLDNDYGFSVVLTFNNFTIFNETLSARNPPPLCIGAPYLEKYVELCVRFYDLDVSRKRFHGCVDAEASLMRVHIAKYDLGCFNVGHLQTLQLTEENIKSSLYSPSVVLI